MTHSSTADPSPISYNLFHACTLLRSPQCAELTSYRIILLHVEFPFIFTESHISLIGQQLGIILKVLTAVVV